MFLRAMDARAPALPGGWLSGNGAVVNVLRTLEECLAAMSGYSFGATLRSIVQQAPRCRGAISMSGHVAAVSKGGHRLPGPLLTAALPRESIYAQAPARWLIARSGSAPCLLAITSTSSWAFR